MAILDAKCPDRRRAARIAGAAFIVIPVLTSLAMFSLKSARADMEHMHNDMGRDAAIGSAIGLGLSIIVDQAARQRDDGVAVEPRKTPKGAARKGDPKQTVKGPPPTKKAPDKPAVVVPEAPKPLAGDPNGGTPVPGGTVTRGTGPVDRSGDIRPGVFCWVTPDGTKACSDFKWFQFVCTIIKSIDRNDGKGPQPPGKVFRTSVPTNNGSFLKVNEWSADDYKTSRGKQREKMLADPAGGAPPCPEADITGGAYDLPLDIPGLPKLPDPAKDKKGYDKQGLMRFVDAPEVAPATDGLVTEGLGIGRISRPSDDKPPDGEPFTMVVALHFRAALYCNRDCLKFFEWTSEETITVTQTWAEKKDKGDAITGGTPRWVSGFVGVRKGAPVVTIGKLKDCPPPAKK